MDTQISGGDLIFSGEDLINVQKLQKRSLVKKETINTIEPVSEINTDWKVCPSCKVKLYDSGFASSECSKCGAEINIVSSEHDIKNSGFSATPDFSGSDNRKAALKKTMIELKKISDNSPEHQIPMDIISKIADNFLKISAHKTHRGGILLALKAKLTQYIMFDDNIFKKNREIISMFGVTEKMLTIADSIIRQYTPEIINIPSVSKDQSELKIKYVLKRNKVDLKYADLILDIIKEMQEKTKNNPTSTNCKPNTKIAATLLLFANIFPEYGITRPIIAEALEVTPNTINRYYKSLCENIDVVNTVLERWQIKKIEPPKKEEAININLILKLENLTI